MSQNNDNIDGSIVRKENHHGVEKDYVRVDIGTRVVEVPRRFRNPLTDKTHDLTNLSDDGYCKKFLALLHATNSPDVVDLGSSPVLTFDKDRWELQEQEGQHVLVKREPETEFGARVMDETGTIEE